MTTIATNLIAALTATFRADSQDLLTTAKALIRAYDENDMDVQIGDAVYRSLDTIQREIQDRIAHENDELSLDLNYPRDLLLHDVLACIAEFYN